MPESSKNQTKIQLTFLGTGTSQGIPVIGSKHPVCLSTDPRDKRLRVSVWIQIDDLSVVIDCGPDFRQQMLQSGCIVMDAILFTHEHADHTAGLDDIRPFCFAQGPIPIYGQVRVLQNLAERFDYIFKEENKYPGAPSIQANTLHKNTPFYLKGHSIKPIEVWHGNVPIFGFRIGNIAYLTDVKSIDPDQLVQLIGVDILVVNALREEEHHSHFTLQEALDFAKRVGAKQTFFTHISHHLGFHAAVSDRLPNGVHLAYDGLVVSTDYVPLPADF
jgi:phosphoribosyl 1,2-cyclic phosphate phosphodiesterase